MTLPSQKDADELCPQAAAARRSRAYHEVLHPVAELVDEQDGEVVHGLPELDPADQSHREDVHR